jgi:PhzF family phenazine biosynthesis protein
MRAPLFQLDSFTTKRFAGNPAAVVLLETFPSDSVMQSIAAENNLAETAFLVPIDDDYQVRWFTPATEVPLCGHATLASASVIMERLEPQRSKVTFHSASGLLPVTKLENGYVMNFPARYSELVPTSNDLIEALGVEPLEVHCNQFNYLALLEDPNVVRTLAPDYARIARLDRSGFIVTAHGDDGYDFVSRYFAPAKGIPEDPVTGGAHCTLTPYWANKLQKTEFRAFQASPRGGEMNCRLLDDRVEMTGACVFYLEGEIQF